jgi:hypothetical protein
VNCSVGLADFEYEWGRGESNPWGSLGRRYDRPTNLVGDVTGVLAWRRALAQVEARSPAPARGDRAQLLDEGVERLIVTIVYSLAEMRQEGLRPVPPDQLLKLLRPPSTRRRRSQST